MVVSTTVMFAASLDLHGTTGNYQQPETPTEVLVPDFPS